MTGKDGEAKMGKHVKRRRGSRGVLAVPETYAIVFKETLLPVGSIGLHKNDLASKLRDLMDEASDEGTRMEIQRLIDKI